MSDDAETFQLPDAQWVTHNLIIALRYGENRGVFIGPDGRRHLEKVRKGGCYVWTTDAEISRRRKSRIPLPEVPPLGPVPQWVEDEEQPPDNTGDEAAVLPEPQAVLDASLCGCGRHIHHRGCCWVRRRKPHTAPSAT